MAPFTQGLFTHTCARARVGKHMRSPRPGVTWVWVPVRLGESLPLAQLIHSLSLTSLLSFLLSFSLTYFHPTHPLSPSHFSSPSPPLHPPFIHLPQLCVVQPVYCIQVVHTFYMGNCRVPVLLGVWPTPLHRSPTSMKRKGSRSTRS